MQPSTTLEKTNSGTITKRLEAIAKNDIPAVNFNREWFCSNVAVERIDSP